MGNISEVSIIMSFGAGMLTFFSPCILPLFPSYIAYISGKSFEELKDISGPSSGTRNFILAHSVFFILGFSLVFVLLGAIVAYLGNFFGIKKVWLEKVGGVLVILFALHMMGLFKVGFLNREKRLTYRKKSISFLGSFLVGMAFSLGWTPCVGPILSSILIYASTQESLFKAVALLTFYSLGIGVPFLIASILVNQFLFLFAKFKKAIRFVPIVTGIFLIFMGIVLFLGRFQELTGVFYK